MRHPTVYLTPADIERGRQNAARFPWAKAIADRIMATANEWAAKDDAWVLAQVPAKGACFAYGFTGCPICGAGWGIWDAGLLRAGEHGEEALLLRFGPSLNHGHFDDLGYNFFGLGYELTYDLGYDLASTHTQVGFAKQTTSHNLVVVDETSQQGMSGGSLDLFADFPSVKMIEASSENSYAGKGVSPLTTERDRP